MIYISVGLPGSGKSTFMKKLAREKGIPYLNTDELTETIYWKEYFQGFFSNTFNKICDLYQEDMVIDCCNITRKIQKMWEDRYPNRAIEWHVFDTPVWLCKERQAERIRKTPDTIIDSMAKDLQLPTSNFIFHQYDSMPVI